MPMTMAKMAQTALLVQDACNMNGPLATFKEIADTLRGEPYKLDSDALARHPVVILFIDKLTDMSRRAGAMDVLDAFEACRVLADAKEVEPAAPFAAALEHTCDECDAKIPDTGDMVSPAHSEACSLHPNNVLDHPLNTYNKKLRPRPGNV